MRWRHGRGWGPCAHLTVRRVFSLNTTMVLRQAKSCLLPGGSEKAFGAAELLKHPEAPWKSPGVCRKFSAWLLPSDRCKCQSVSLVELSGALYLVGALGPQEGRHPGRRLLSPSRASVAPCGARWPSSQMPGSE